MKKQFILFHNFNQVEYNIETIENLFNYVFVLEFNFDRGVIMTIRDLLS